MALSALRKRAVSMGASEAQLEAADDADQPRDAMFALITTNMPQAQDTRVSQAEKHDAVPAAFAVPFVPAGPGDDEDPP